MSNVVHTLQQKKEDKIWPNIYIYNYLKVIVNKIKIPSSISKSKVVDCIMLFIDMIILLNKLFKINS